MFLHRTRQHSHLVCGVGIFSHLLTTDGDVHQSTHGIGSTIHIRIALCIACRSTSAHRKSGNGTMPLITFHPVSLLYIRKELLIEEIFVSPTRHVEVAVPASSRIASCIGADDNHLASLARCHQLVHHVLHTLVCKPTGIHPRHAVQQIEDRIFPIRFIAIALRQIDGVGTVCFQYLAVDAVGHYLALRSPCRILCICHPQQADGKKREYQSFHGIDLKMYYKISVFHSKTN